MDRQQSIAVLNRVLHSTVNSVVQYIDIAVPYVPPGFEEEQEALRRLREEEAATAHRLTDMVAALDGVPKVGVFPYWNVDLNYLDLRWLAGFAAQQQEKAVVDTETDLKLVRDDPQVLALLREILEQKRTHLEKLRAVASKPGPEIDEERRQKAQPKDSQHVPRP